jgi:hypothetical protein
VDIWQILVQFMFRLTFGIALSMVVTPSRLVTSGFYRVHLWVLMGINTFAALAVYNGRDSFLWATVDRRWLLALAVTLAVLSYIGATLWLYERRRAGTKALLAIGLLGLLASLLATRWPVGGTGWTRLLPVLDLMTGGLLLGATMTAMLLGHWYLNTPTMQLVPLRRLVWLMAAAVVARAALCGVGLTMQLTASGQLATWFWVFLAFRWLSGLLGTMVMAVLTWQTLRIPNTQSATGILYAGVILAFLGELTSQLLSVDKLYPL